MYIFRNNNLQKFPSLVKRLLRLQILLQVIKKKCKDSHIMCILIIIYYIL